MKHRFQDTQYGLACFRCGFMKASAAEECSASFFPGLNEEVLTQAENEYVRLAGLGMQIPILIVREIAEKIKFRDQLAWIATVNAELDTLKDKFELVREENTELKKKMASNDTWKD